MRSIPFVVTDWTDQRISDTACYRARPRKQRSVRYERGGVVIMRSAATTDGCQPLGTQRGIRARHAMKINALFTTAELAVEFFEYTISFVYRCRK